MSNGMSGNRAVHLQSYLACKFPEFGRIETIAPLPGGFSNPTMDIVTNGGRYVLRARPQRADPRQHRIDREYRVQKALFGSGLPVAEVLHYCSSADVLGTEFYLMRHVSGRVVPTAECTGYSPEQRTTIWQSLVEVLADLHKLDWHRCGLSDFGRPQAYLSRQIDIWSTQLRAPEAGELPEVPFIEEWLRRNLPRAGRASIVHGDYRVGNVILEGPRPRIAAVLDWELSTIGDPLADLGYLCLPYSLPADSPAATGGLLGQDLDTLGIPQESQLIAEYGRLTAHDEIDITFYKGLAFYRTVAIMRGVKRRAEIDPDRADLARDYDTRSRQLAHLALNYLSAF